MNLKQIALSVVLALFLAHTGVVLYEHGYLGFFELIGVNSATRLLAIDLGISLTLISVWMVVDARRRGAAWLPYVLIAASFGAAGPLLYLIRRESQGAPQVAHQH